MNIKITEPSLGGLTVLVVDPEVTGSDSLKRTLSKSGVDVHIASDCNKALKILSEVKCDVCAIDWTILFLNNDEFLEKIKIYSPSIVVLGESASLDNSRFPYVVSKPLDLREFVALLRKVSGDSTSKDGDKIKTLEEFRNQCLRGEIIGSHNTISNLRREIDAASKTEATVLIEGESGVGKELVATSIHYNSSRKNSPFVRVNCGTIPDGLLESELFGHEKGSFTGAFRQRKGKFELANRGTIFLDEICNASEKVQVDLLRVAEVAEFERVGGEYTLRLDVRLIAASNLKLEDEIKARRFRSDLYYRLNVVRIEVPPLRERVSDIPILSYYFLKKYASEMERKVSYISRDALQIMMQYDWPGNIRELKNAVMRALVLFKRDYIALDDLPKEIVSKVHRSEFTGTNYKIAKTGFEKRFFTELLIEYKGDVIKAAERSELPLRTFYYKLKEHRIDPKNFK